MGLSEKILYHVAMNVGKTKIPSFETVGEPLVVVLPLHQTELRACVSPVRRMGEIARGDPRVRFVGYLVGVSGEKLSKWSDR